MEGDDADGLEGDGADRMEDDDADGLEEIGAREKPPAPPDLPSYVVDPLERQSAERLEAVATYARELAAHRRARNADVESDPDALDASEVDDDTLPPEPVDDDELSSLANRGVSTDPGDYVDVPDVGAYVTVKETKPGYRYYYWQWRDGDAWKNQYIAPVDDG